MFLGLSAHPVTKWPLTRYQYSTEYQVPLFCVKKKKNFSYNINNVLRSSPYSYYHCQRGLKYQCLHHGYILFTWMIVIHFFRTQLLPPLPEQRLHCCTNNDGDIKRRDCLMIAAQTTMRSLVGLAQTCGKTRVRRTIQTALTLVAVTAWKLGS
jgi:hypothetical protein